MNITNVVKFLNEQQVVLELNGQVIDVSSIVGDPNNRKISIVGRYPIKIIPNFSQPLFMGTGICEFPYDPHYQYPFKDNSDIPMYHTDGIRIQDPIHINELPHEQEENILGMGEHTENSEQQAEFNLKKTVRSIIGLE